MKLSLLSTLLALATATELYPPRSPSSKTTLHKRIIGGQDAKPGQFPHSAALFRDGRFVCGATIISPVPVVTLAACVTNNFITARPRNLHAIANVRRSAPGPRVDFERLIVHPEFDGQRNNMAVLTASSPIAIGNDRDPPALYRGKVDEAINATAVGWGGKTGRTLTSPVSDTLGYKTEITTIPCPTFQGGSGLFIEEDGKMYLAGISAGLTKGPVAYWTDISHHASFLDENAL